MSKYKAIPLIIILEVLIWVSWHIENWIVSLEQKLKISWQYYVDWEPRSK